MNLARRTDNLNKSTGYNTNMETLSKKGNDLNPDVLFDQNTSTLTMKGKSIPLNSQAFFADIINWLESYSNHPNPTTNFEIDLQYLNGQSIRSLLEILSKFQALSLAGNNVNVSWSVPKDADDIADLSSSVLNRMNLPYQIHLN